MPGDQENLIGANDSSTWCNCGNWSRRGILVGGSTFLLGALILAGIIACIVIFAIPKSSEGPPVPGHNDTTSTTTTTTTEPTTQSTSTTTETTTTQETTTETTTTEPTTTTETTTTEGTTTETTTTQETTTTESTTTEGTTTETTTTEIPTTTTEKVVTARIPLYRTRKLLPERRKETESHSLFHVPLILADTK